MSRVNEIKKRIAKRKRLREKNLGKSSYISSYPPSDDDYSYPFSSYEVKDDEEIHPLFNTEKFFLKLLTSACLFLIVAIIFKQNFPVFEPVKAFVTKTMETEFEFAMVSNWYEENFGKPLALLPLPQLDQTEAVDNMEYALPASARILEGFRENGQKITIETAKGANVSVMNGGRVRFIGEEEGFGKTVIIQHSDKSETWYGNLDKIYVSLYEYIEKGAYIGTVSNGENDEKGMFFFALKKGDHFIDPIQVIQFE